MKKLDESRIDRNGLFFHGSAGPLKSRLDRPSFEHPFYVTADLHYAMAFCTKHESSTGEWNVEKTYNPDFDSNCCYVVTVSPTARFFDFRKQDDAEFQDLSKILPESVVKYVLGNFPTTDVYGFCISLSLEIIDKLVESGFDYDTYSKNANESPRLDSRTFSDACGMVEKFGYDDQTEMHEIMAPILRGLSNLGYDGLMTSEEDVNEETRGSVSTSYAIGIWNADALDMMCVTPMKYRWLKRTNAAFARNRTSEDAETKIRRYVSLYRKIKKES